MAATPTIRVDGVSVDEAPIDSIFRCSECGSFLDVARVNPETKSLARKCVACLEWYPVAGPRWEGSD